MTDTSCAFVPVSEERYAALVAAEQRLAESDAVAAYFRSILNRIADIVPFPGCDYGDLITAVERLAATRDEQP